MQCTIANEGIILAAVKALRAVTTKVFVALCQRLIRRSARIADGVAVSA